MSSREPLAVAGAVVGFLQALVTTVVLMGWWELTAEQTAAWLGLIAVGGTTAALAWTVWRVRPQVTPVADPRLPDGD